MTEKQVRYEDGEWSREIVVQDNARPMTALDIDAIKARLLALSDFDGEEWQVWYGPNHTPFAVGPDNSIEEFRVHGMSEDDAKFVAAAPEMVRDLVAEVERREAMTVRLLAIVDPIVEKGKDQIGTHSDRCFEYHHGCLAVLVQSLLTAPAATSDSSSTGGQL